MKSEQAKSIATEALKRLAEALKQGRSAEIIAYLRTMARFHHYSFTNSLLIMCQRPDATRVAGFHTWRKLGRIVRKGEKGIAIFAPMMITRRADDTSEADSDQSERVLRFRVVHVFDIEQTEGEPLPEAPSVGGDPGEALERLRSLVAARDVSLAYDALPVGVDGASFGGRITIRRGLEPAHEFSVIAHELAHEMLHQCDKPEDRPSKTVRETEAEAVAFVVCSAAGLATGSASSDYIQLYAGSDETLSQSLERIQRCASEIIAGVLESEIQAPSAL